MCVCFPACVHLNVCAPVVEPVSYGFTYINVCFICSALCEFCVSVNIIHLSVSCVNGLVCQDCLSVCLSMDLWAFLSLCVILFVSVCMCVSLFLCSTCIFSVLTSLSARLHVSRNTFKSLYTVCHTPVCAQYLSVSFM